MPTKRPPKEPPKNPLFAQWLKEWGDEELSKAKPNDNMVILYRRATRSVLEHPTVLPTGTAAKAIKGIGDKLATRLNERLKKHLEDSGQGDQWALLNQPPEPKAPAATKRAKGSAASDPELTAQATAGSASPEPAPKKRRTPAAAAAGLPKYRSGGWAVLIAFHLESLKAGWKGHLTRHELIDSAGPWCDSSQAGTARATHPIWVGVRALEKKGWAVQDRVGTRTERVFPTEEGLRLTKEIYEVWQSTPDGLKAMGGADDGPSGPRQGPSGLQNAPAASRTGDSQEMRSSHDLGGPSNVDALWTGGLADLTTTEPSIFHPPVPSTAQEATAGLTQKQALGSLPSCAAVCAKTGVSGRQTSSLTSTSAPDEAPIRLERRTLSDDTVLEGGAKLGPSNSMTSFASSNPSRDARTLATSVGSSVPPEAASLSRDRLDKMPGLQFTPFVLARDTFEIVLVLDNREIFTQGNRVGMQHALHGLGVLVETRPLQAGDFIWIARRKAGAGAAPAREHEEIVLDTIVERKRMEDLVASIKDNRYLEQKFRLSLCGLRHVIYLVEMQNMEAAVNFGMNSIITAFCGTLVVSEFFLKTTQDTASTCEYLALMTRMLQLKYQHESLLAVPPDVLTREVVGPNLTKFIQALGERDSLEYLVTLETFSSLNSKSKSLTLTDIWTKQVMTIRGVSADKAMTIIRQYPTLHALMAAYAEAETRSGTSSAELMLSEVGDGGCAVVARKRIGPALSRKIWETFRLRQVPPDLPPPGATCQFGINLAVGGSGTLASTPLTTAASGSGKTLAPEPLPSSQHSTSTIDIS